MTKLRESSAISAEYITEKTGIKISGLAKIDSTIQPKETHYLVYKIWNQINGKYYIGQHATDNPLDEYMGSGKAIKLAEEKYSLSAFVKEILFDFKTFEDMNQKERDLVQLSSCWPVNPKSYNLKEGGASGVLNPHSQEIRIQHVSETWKSKPQEEKDAYSAECRARTLGKNNPMFGKNSRDFMEPEAIEQMDEKRRKKWASKTQEEMDEMRRKQAETIANRTPEKQAEVHVNLSRAASGKNNPMYGRRGKDNPLFGKRGKDNPLFGTKMMTPPGYKRGEKRKPVKPADFDRFLALGYTFEDKNFVYIPTKLDIINS